MIIIRKRNYIYSNNNTVIITQQTQLLLYHPSSTVTAGFVICCRHIVTESVTTPENIATGSTYDGKYLQENVGWQNMLVAHVHQIIIDNHGEKHHEKGGLYQVQAGRKLQNADVSASGIVDEKITMPYENESVLECEIMPSRSRVGFSQISLRQMPTAKCATGSHMICTKTDRDAWYDSI